eukprot:1161159-Pelagomonas_calceolata.AAC.1
METVDKLSLELTYIGYDSASPPLQLLFCLSGHAGQKEKKRLRKPGPAAASFWCLRFLVCPHAKYLAPYEPEKNY